MIFKRLTFLIVLFIASVLTLKAQQPGTPDLSFNPTDNGLDTIGGLGGECVIIQPDGKYISSGNRIRRLWQDGTLDTTFFVGSLLGEVALDLKLQSDGKVLAAGRFQAYNGVPRNSILRLNPNGTLDTNFNVGTGLNHWAYTLAVQPDGKVLVGGEFNTYNGDSTGCLVRLEPDGSRDTTFQSFGAIPSGYVSRLALQSDGKILVGGSHLFSNHSTYSNNHILLRLNADGSLDTTFSAYSFTLNGQIDCILVLPDDKIVAAGWFTSFNGTSVPRGIIRLHPDGSHDAAFTPGGFSGGASNVNVTQIDRFPDGKIVAVGDFEGYGGNPAKRIVRINSDGTFDSTFVMGTGFNPRPVSVTAQPDGKMIVSGSFTRYNTYGSNRIIRLNPDGSRDSSFFRVQGVNGVVMTILKTPFNKFIIGGFFSSYNQNGSFSLCQLNSDGSFDTTFSQHYQDIRTVSDIALQADEKIVVKGWTFTPYCPPTVLRLNSAGNFDTTFIPVTSPIYGPTGKIAIQPWDQKVIVTRSLDYLQRLMPDGSLDSSFISGQICDERISSLLIQPDRKIIIGGNFTIVHGQPRQGIARLMPDGTLDTTFLQGSGFIGGYDGVTSLALQSDGKILAGGDFTGYNGTMIRGIIRLLPNGSIDPAFQPGSGIFGGPVRSILIQPDGKIIAGGAFDYFQVWSNPSSGLIRLHPNGTHDTGFQVGSGFPYNRGIYAMAFTPDWKIIAAGDFNSYQGVGKNRIIKIHAENITCNTPPFDILFNKPSNHICHSDSITLYRSGGVFAPGGSFKWYSGSCGGTLIGSGDSITVSPSVTTNYFVRAESPCGSSVCATITIVVNTFTPPQITGNLVGCNNQPVQLGVTGNWLSLQWSTGDTTSTILAANSGNYSVTALSAFPFCYVTSQISVVNIVPPVMAQITGDTVICTGSTVALNAGIHSGYLWNTGQNTQVINVQNPGTYSVIVIDPFGCTGTDTFSLTSLQSPVVNILASGPTSFCAGDSVELNASPGLASYVWHRHFNIMPNSTTSSVWVKTRGTYYCVVTDNNGCSDTSNVITVYVPCISVDPPVDKSFTEDPDEVGVRIFPNPAEGVFTVEIHNAIFESVPEIFDVTGKKMSYNILNRTGSQILISGFAPGLYMIKTKISGHHFINKLILK